MAALLPAPPPAASLGACSAPAPSAPAADHIVAFPSGNANLISVYRADDLSLAGTIPAPASSYAVEQNLDGSKYYILNRQAERSITVVDADSLEVIDEIDLGAGSSAQEMTPDGRFLLVAAATLHVIDTLTDQVVMSIPVGGAPTRIIVNNTSTRAYVLANSGRLIERTINTVGASDVALTEDGARLLVALRDGVRQIRTRNFEEIDVIPANFNLINASLFPIPGTQKVIAQNRGVAPANTSQLFDLDTGDVDDIGNVGLTELECLSYLRDNLYFYLGPREHRGLALFFEQATDLEPAIASYERSL